METGPSGRVGAAPPIGEQVTALMVHYRTPDLLRVAVESFYGQCPDVPMLVFDNGSIGSPEGEASRTLFEELESRFAPALRIERHPRNLFHGPALDLALRDRIETPYAFILDSDTRTLRPGFLPAMVERLEADERHYAIGAAEQVNERGFKQAGGMRILLTPYLLLRTALYPRFEPIVHHGQPTLFHFRDAQRQGYVLLDFPIESYIEHEWRGTASRFGYRLGWRGRIDYLLNRLGM